MRPPLHSLLPSTLLALLLAACGVPGGTGAPLDPPTTSEARDHRDTLEPSPDEPAPPPKPSTPVPLGHGSTRIDGIAVEFVRFDSRTHRLAVVDQARGPGSEFTDSRAAGRARGALAAINGGFFTPEGEPLGRVISDGQSRGAINRASSLGAGFLVETSGGQLQIVRRRHFAGGRQALQSGPFLTENHRPVGGLDAEARAARSWVATDGNGGWLVARSGPSTLAGLAAALEGAEIGGIRPRTALNLDGGRSSELWVAPEVPGGPAFTRPLWNKPVRNFLVLRPR